MRKLGVGLALLTLGITRLWAAQPATLSVGSQVLYVSSAAAPIFLSTVSVNVGSTSVLGATDFTVQFDTTVARMGAVQTLANMLQGSVYYNPAQFTGGSARIVALNGVSTQTPTGYDPILGLGFTGLIGSKSTATVTAQVLTFVDTQPVSFFPISTTSGTVSIVADYLPPRTSLQIGQPNSGANPVYVSSQTLFGLTAVDDQYVVGDGHGVGVAQTYYAVDTTSYTVYSGSFSIVTGGLHSLRWYSTDLAGNTEVVKSTLTAVDTTPPITQIALSTPEFVDSFGNTYVSTSSTVGFTAVDPISSNVASGVAFTEYRVDPSTPTAAFLRFTSTSAFTLNEGVHLVQFMSVDAVGNVESTKSQTLDVDKTPPITTASFSQAVSTSAGSATILNNATLILTSTDPVSAGVASGVSSTRFLVDVATATCAGGLFGPVLSTQTAGTCGNTLWSGPISLPPGTHVVIFASVDNVGNAELPNVLTIYVQGTSNVGGRGLGLDNSNLLWSVADDGSTVALAHNSPTGVITASATLVNADPAFPWSVFFDTAGSAYAVGAAIAANGADQLAIYKASPAGDAIISSQTFDSGFNNNNLVFGIAQPGWIVGSVQTSGPINQSSGTRSYELAIWHFNPTTGLIQLTTTYTRAGFDVATGVSVDGSGNLWVAGFSESPNPRSPRVFDLALWKFAPNGQTLLAGPIINEGYLSNFDTSQLAEVTLSSNTVYVAAPRGRATAGTDIALTSYALSSGQELSINAWSSADGSSAFPGALLQDNTGKIVAAGGFDYGDGGTLAGLWKYAANGSLVSSAQVDAGGARGAVFNGSNLWLSVDGSSSPYLVSVSTPAPGSLDDVEPPRTSVGATPPSGMGAILYAGSGSEFYLYAVDDLYAVGDGLGTGPLQTFFSIDSSSFTVYSSSFSLAEGSHTLQYYSVDLTGNAEVIKSTTVAADDTPPVTTLQILGSTTTDPSGVVLVSSSTSFALSAIDPLSNGVASGVAATYYVIDQDPFSPSCESTPLDPSAPNGTCANEVYDSSFTLALGTHTVYYFSEDVAGNQETVNVASYTIVSTLNDDLPPRTSLVLGPPSFSSGTLTYITSASTLGLVAVDDALVVGDGLGVGVAATYVSLNGGPFKLYSGGTTTIPTEGLDTASYYSVDLLGHTEAVKTSTIAVDDTPPVVTLSILGSSSTASGFIVVSSGTPFALAAVDPISNGVASGVAQITYLIDVSSTSCQNVAFSSTATQGTCANPNYTAPFIPANGVHLLTYGAMDEVGNTTYISTMVVVGVPGASEPVVAVSSASPGFAVALGTATINITGAAFAAGAQAGLLRLRESGSGWSSAPAMAHARKYGTLTLMADGTVLAAGGIDSTGNPSASAELFDPTLQVWVPLAPMNVARASFTATLLSDGRLLAIGGSGAGGVALASAETYSPATGQWTTTGSMANARGGGQKSVLLQSGLALVAGGKNSAVIAAAEVYSPTTGLWSTAGSLHAARSNAPLVLLPNGQVLIAGGTSGSASLATAEIYTPSANSWATTGSLVAARKDATAVLLDGGTKVLIAGGSQSSDLSSSELYNVSSGTWSAGPNLNAARTLHAMAFTGEGVPLVIGGENSSGELSSVEYYSNNSWTTTSSLPLTFDYVRAVVLDNGDILTAGGQHSGQPTAQTALYALDFKPTALASSVNVTGSTQAIATVPLTGAATGYWAVALRNANQQIALLPGAFQVLPAPADVLPPRTSVVIGPPSFSSGSLTYITSVSTLGFVAVDDRSTIGDGLGVGVATTYFSINGGPYNIFQGTGTISAEGLYTISYYSVDLVGNVESTHTVQLAVDDTPPVTTLQVLGSSTTDAYGDIDITAGTPLALSAVDPISNGVASGVAATYYVIDVNPFSPACAATPLDPTAPNGTCANELYDSSFTLTGGTHTVYFFSEDNVGNQETVNVASFTVTVAVADTLPPRTTLDAGTPNFSSGTLTYATAATTFSLTAVDDLSVIGDGLGVGVAATYLAIDTTTFSPYTGPFSISTEGLHVVSFYSVDYDSHVEVAHSSSVAVDLTPPITTLQVLGSSTTDSFGNVDISSAVPLALSAVDPISNGVASGVAATYYVIDVNPFSPACEATPLDPTQPNGTCANEAYDGSFTLGVGTHTVYYFSEDDVGNQEAVNVASFTVNVVDVLPPRTSLVFGSPSVAGSTFTFISTTTPLSLVAVDDGQTVGDGLGVGVAVTYVAIDSAAFSVYTSSFSLAAPGPHTISFYSVDKVGNAEVAHSSAVVVDAAPPSLAFSPVSGSTVTVSTPTLAAVYADVTGISTSSVRLQLDGVSVTTQSVITVTSASYTPLYALSQGTHTLAASVSDNFGNVASSSATFFLDSIPPATALLVDGLSTSATSLLLVSTDTLGFVAVDSGSGVAQTLYSIDASTPVVYTSTFSVAIGTHSLAFHSVDKAGNVEATHSVALSVRLYDTTPPTLTLNPPTGSTATTTTPTITAIYVDTGSSIVAASVSLAVDGVNVTTRSVVTSSSATYIPTAGLAQGTHTVTASVADAAGNVAYATSTFFLDSVPPVTTLLVDGLAHSATSLTLISTDTVGFVAVDSGTGVAETLYALDSSTPIVYTSTFSVAVGTHTLAFHSVDNAGNVESSHVVALSVRAYDITPPTLTLTPPGGSTVTVATPTIAAVYVDTGSSINTATLALAIDGVNVTTRAIVTASSATYIPTAALAQGTHTVTASVADLDGNVAYATSTFFLDSNPPVTTLLVDGLTRSATSLLLVSTDTLGFVAIDTGSPVAQTLYALDASTPIVYTSTFSVAVGTHTLAFHSVDAAGNVEPAHVVALNVRSYDVTPPTLTLTPPIGSTVTTATPTIAAVYVDTGSAVNSATLKFALDGASIATSAVVTASSATYVPAAALSQGTHTVTASVADLDGNVAYATSTFFLDSIPPVTTLLVDGLARSATSLTLISTDTIGFVAVDSGTGVAETLYALDSSTPVVYTSTFSVAVGTHTLAYHSVDKSGNVETTHTVALSVRSYDLTPPTLTLTPPSGSTVTIATPTIAAVYVDTGSPVNTATLVLALDGVNVTTRAAINVSSATYVPTAALAQGTHTVTAQISDAAGNVAYATSTFFLDSVPPVTTLQVDGLTRGATNLVLITTDTLDFVAVDSGTGVAETLYALDASSPVVYAAPFHISSGTHSLAYHSVDKAGNVEAAHVVGLSVTLYDITAPTLALTPPIGSTVTITTPTITAVYVDTGSAISTATFKLALDGTAITTHLVVTASSATYVPAAALAQGTHTVTAQIADVDGNVAYATSTFFLDSISPVTTLLVDGLTRSATSMVLVTTDTIGFVAVDSGTGVAATYYSLNGGAQTVYVSTFSLAAGSYTLAYHSVDKAGNVEAAHTVSLTVKAGVVAPPTLTLTPATGALVNVATPTITAVYVDTGSPVVLASFVLTLDGENVTSHTTVGASTATYVPTTALAQGLHTAVASIANAAGLRAAATSTFFLDTVPPVTSLRIDGLTRGATSLVIVTTDTIGFVAVDTGSGVAETFYSVDSTTYELVYAAPFSLAIGTYTVDYHSVDKAGNVEKTHVVALDVEGPGGPFRVRARFEPFIIVLNAPGSIETAFLGVSGERDASMIDPASLSISAVNGVQLRTHAIAVLSSPPSELIEVRGQPVLQAQFSQTALAAVLPVDVESTLTVSGRFKDGVAFYAFGRALGLVWWKVPLGRDATLRHRSGASVYLPQGAATAGTNIALVLIDTSTVDDDAPGEDSSRLTQLVMRGAPYELASDATFLAQPAILSLPYDPESLGFQGTQGLIVGAWNAGSGTWQPLGSTSNAAQRTVSASVKSFTRYQAATSQNSAATASSMSPQSFFLRSTTASPNPSRNGAPIDFQIATGLADSVQLDVYAPNGAHAVSTTLGSPSTRGGQLYYDYIWNATGATTGNYAYYFTARKAGSPDVVASGRVQIYR